MDWTINLGHILTIISFLIAATGCVYTIRTRVDALSSRLLAVEDEIKKLTDVLVLQGRHDERMNSIDSRMVMYAARLDDFKRQVDRLFSPAEHGER